MRSVIIEMPRNVETIEIQKCKLYNFETKEEIVGWYSWGIQMAYGGAAVGYIIWDRGKDIEKETRIREREDVRVVEVGMFNL